jgi:hypothetical protein
LISQALATWQEWNIVLDPEAHVQVLVIDRLGQPLRTEARPIAFQPGTNFQHVPKIVRFLGYDTRCNAVAPRHGESIPRTHLGRQGTAFS